MMRGLPLLAIGLSLVLLGAGLFALTLRKPKAAPPNPTKTQLREQASLQAETKKMRAGAGVLAGLGVAVLLLLVIS